MATRIAVTVDGTPACAGALAHAVRLSREVRANLTGVFVIDDGWADFIGSDWQSSRNARQGFLDYVLAEQQRHEAAARAQFATATAGLPEARFTTLVGAPDEELVRLMKAGATDLLVAGREAYRACGRPSSKALASTLVRKIRQSVHVV